MFAYTDLYFPEDFATCSDKSKLKVAISVTITFCYSSSKPILSSPDTLPTAVTLMDGLVVLGGGLTAAAKYFMPALLEEMRGKIRTLSGDELGRLQMEVFNLDEPEQFARFAAGASRRLKVYGTEDTVIYDPMKRTGVAVSKLGASKAISVGAYNFALSQLDGE